MHVAAGVDQIDAGEIPASNTHGGTQQRAVGGGQLVADAGDGEGAIAGALLTRDLHAKSAAQLVAGGRRSADRRPGKPALERRLLGLAVNAAVVLLLDPGLGGAVEQLEGELGHALEHGHETALDLSPEDFLLAVLLGGLRESGEVLDGQALEALLCLGGNHGSAVVAEQSTRQTTLLEALTQAVHEALGVFVAEVPLGVTAQARAIIEQPEKGGDEPLAASGQDLALGVVKIAVPDGTHVRDLERTFLAGNEAGGQLVAARLVLLA